MRRMRHTRFLFATRGRDHSTIMLHVTTKERIHVVDRAKDYTTRELPVGSGRQHSVGEHGSVENVRGAATLVRRQNRRGVFGPHTARTKT